MSGFGTCARVRSRSRVRVAVTVRVREHLLEGEVLGMGFFA